MAATPVYGPLPIGVDTRDTRQWLNAVQAETRKAVGQVREEIAVAKKDWKELPQSGTTVLIAKITDPGPPIIADLYRGELTGPTVQTGVTITSLQPEIEWQNNQLIAVVRALGKWVALPCCLGTAGEEGPTDCPKITTFTLKRWQDGSFITTDFTGNFSSTADPADAAIEIVQDGSTSSEYVTAQYTAAVVSKGKATISIDYDASAVGSANSQWTIVLRVYDAWNPGTPPVTNYVSSTLQGQALTGTLSLEDYEFIHGDGNEYIEIVVQVKHIGAVEAGLTVGIDNFAVTDCGEEVPEVPSEEPEEPSEEPEVPSETPSEFPSGPGCPEFGSWQVNTRQYYEGEWHVDEALVAPYSVSGVRPLITVTKSHTEDASLDLFYYLRLYVTSPGTGYIKVCWEHDATTVQSGSAVEVYLMTAADAYVGGVGQASGYIYGNSGDLTGCLYLGCEDYEWSEDLQDFVVVRKPCSFETGEYIRLLVRNAAGTQAGQSKSLRITSVQLLQCGGTDFGCIYR